MIPSIPKGLCQCGCGQTAPIATQTSSKYGCKKGEPRRFIHGHHSCTVRSFSAENLIDKTNLPFPYGDCQCGCGETTGLATSSDYRLGYKKGDPLLFVPGHQTVRRSSPLNLKKFCKRCQHEKNRTDFLANKRYPDGLTINCRDCTYAVKREYMAKSPERYLAIAKKSNLRKFGLSLDAYNSLYQLQEGRCAICDNTEPILDKNGNPHCLAVDHDHVTGQVRGLLCRNCNWAIGHFKDNPDLLMKASLYLQATPSKIQSWRQALPYEHIDSGSGKSDSEKA